MLHDKVQHSDLLPKGSATLPSTVLNLSLIPFTFGGVHDGLERQSILRTHFGAKERKICFHPSRSSYMRPYVQSHGTKPCTEKEATVIFQALWSLNPEPRKPLTA